MKIESWRQTTQALQNPSKDPLANIYLQHMDLVYRLCNVKFAKSYDKEEITIIKINKKGLWSYMYEGLTIIPFVWSNNSKGQKIKIEIC